MATFIAISINQISKGASTSEQIKNIKSQFDEINEDKEKIGIPLDITCEHPLIDKKLPIFIANVLDSYGEGAIFGCLAQDERIMNLQKNINYPS